MVVRCTCAECPFRINCSAKRGDSTWRVNAHTSKWQHGGPGWKCSSKPVVDVRRCSKLPSVQQHVLQKSTADEWRNSDELANWMEANGFAPPQGNSKKQHAKVYLNLVKTIFGETEKRRTEDLQKLFSWRDEFNAMNNGLCIVGTEPAAASSAAASGVR